MDSRERVKLALRRQTPDRVPRHDHFWQQAHRDILRESGAHPNADINDVLDLDIRALSFDASARLDHVTVSEDDDYVVHRDSNGTTIRHIRDEQTTGEHIDFAMKDRDTWQREYRDRYAYHRSRINLTHCREMYDYWRRAGRYIVFSVLDQFEATWHKCGPTQHLMAYVEDPEWLRDMYAVHTELCEAAFEEFLGAGIEFDGAWFWGDIAYKNTSMVSPNSYCEMLQPFHKRLCDMVHAADGEVIHHSDGNLHGLLPHLLDAGFDCIQPMEVKADMDVRDLKKTHGDRASFMGNIDARLFQQNDLGALETEIRDKISAAKAGGGYIYHSDHSVPPGTTLKTYQRAMDLVEHYGKY